VFACLCLIALLRSAYPLLAREMSRILVSWPREPSHGDEAQIGNAYHPNQVHLDISPAGLGKGHAPRPLKSGSALDVGHVTVRRFLAFLPHSGFNNQRIALENAMLLAYILNCTLVVPPARLGAPLPYRPFSTLERHYLTSAKHEPEECAKGLNYTPPECIDRRYFTLIPWDELVDLRSVRDELGLDVLFVRGSETPRQFLRHALGVPDKSIVFLKDRDLYQYRIHDTQHSPDEARPTSKYQDEWHVDYLRTLVDDFPAIHFGSLFGSGRIKLHQPEYVATRTKISRAMVISHSAILDTAHAIRTKITRFSQDRSFYLAVHIRVGDRKFKGAAGENARTIWWYLIAMLGISEETGVKLEHRFLHKLGKNGRRPSPRDLPVFKYPIKPWFNSSEPYHSHERCVPSHEDLGMEASYLGVPLFIATDARNPRMHSLFAIFFETFPCTFVLPDFSEDLKPLVSLRRPGDASSVGQFLLPLVDAVVAGHATHVIGTQNR
jgi:hypothetical protein